MQSDSGHDLHPVLQGQVCLLQNIICKQRPILCMMATVHRISDIVHESGDLHKFNIFFRIAEFFQNLCCQLCHQSRMRLRMIGESHGSQIRISLFNKCQYFFIFSNFTICHSSTSFLPSCVNSRVFIYILFRVHCTIRPQIRAMIRYILFRSRFFLQGAFYITKTVSASLSRMRKQHVISV